jgi:putative NADH-flavin reductase
MSRILILGATGSLGRCVLRQAIADGHDVTVFVRTPSRLEPEILGRTSVRTGDLSHAVPIALIEGHEALINCAGHVREGDQFVALVDRLVTAVDALPSGKQPVCWFLAGAALLDIGSSGRRALDAPGVRSTYWPHEANFERLRRSSLEWRLLCPGPMVDQPPLGLTRLRVTLDTLPVQIPASVGAVSGPLSPSILGSLMPRLMVPYADAAAVMLANLDRESAMSRHRVGLAPSD